MDHRIALSYSESTSATSKSDRPDRSLRADIWADSPTIFVDISSGSLHWGRPADRLFCVRHARMPIHPFCVAPIFRADLLLTSNGRLAEIGASVGRWTIRPISCEWRKNHTWRSEWNRPAIVMILNDMIRHERRCRVRPIRCRRVSDAAALNRGQQTASSSTLTSLVERRCLPPSLYPSPTGDGLEWEKNV